MRWRHLDLLTSVVLFWLLVLPNLKNDHVLRVASIPGQENTIPQAGSKAKKRKRKNLDVVYSKCIQ